MSAEDLARVAVDREKLLAQLDAAKVSAPEDVLAAAIRRAGRIAQASPRYHRSVVRRGLWDWEWQIVDEAPSPHVTVASGRAWSHGRAWVRLERAYADLLEQHAKDGAS